MRRIFSKQLYSALCCALLTTLTVSGCSKDEDPPPVSNCEPNEVGCAAEGEMCFFSINCPAGNICNKTTDELYDADKAADTCVKVVCASDSECTAPKTCSLERICEAPVCQNNNDCSGGNICSGGACVPPANAADVASCTVVTPSGAIRQGATLELAAVARNANGVVLPSIRFTWASSNPNAVAVAEEVATGGTMNGAAELTAKVLGNESVTCGRSVTLNNFATLAAGEVRVVLVADDNGQPVDGAEVTLIAGGNPTTQTTGADGSTTFAGVGGAAESITVIKTGWQYISVISPPNDVFLPVPRFLDRTKAGGFRGSIDISAARRGDVKLGIAGPSLPSNLLDFEFESLIGDFINTTIDAPELGLNNENVDLPGGVVFALGSKKFTDDSAGANTRCQGQAPTEDELGCYVARAPAGPRAAWTLAGRLTLASVSQIAGTLTSAFGGGGTEDLPIGDILTKVLPLLRSLNHGINAGLVIEEFPKVNVAGQNGNCADPNLPDYDDKCQGDFSRYQQISLAASQRLAIDSAVTVPTLPRSADGSYADGVVVISAAITEGRGMVPLGLSAGLDVLEDETADGRVAGVEKPFGEQSQKLDDGEVPLTMAPPHSGVEGSKIAMVAIAIDQGAISGDGGVQFSGIVRFVDRIDAQSSFGNASFLAAPTGTVDVATARFTPTAAVAGAGIVRIELGRGANTWLVYAPAGATPIEFPNVARARADIVGAGMDAYIQAVRSTTPFADVFTFGSGKNLDRAIEQIEGFVVQQCVSTAGSPCVIQ